MCDTVIALEIGEEVFSDSWLSVTVTVIVTRGYYFPYALAPSV
jgi:hypothetical protein